MAGLLIEPLRSAAALLRRQHGTSNAVAHSRTYVSADICTQQSPQTFALDRARLLPPRNSVYVSQLNWPMIAFFWLVDA